MADVADVRLLAIDGVPDVRVMAPKPPKVMFLQNGARIELMKSEETGA